VWRLLHQGSRGGPASPSIGSLCLPASSRRQRHVALACPLPPHLAGRRRGAFGGGAVVVGRCGYGATSGAGRSARHGGGSRDAGAPGPSGRSSSGTGGRPCRPLPARTDGRTGPPLPGTADHFPMAPGRRRLPAGPRLAGGDPATGAGLFPHRLVRLLPSTGTGAARSLRGRGVSSGSAQGEDQSGAWSRRERDLPELRGHRLPVPVREGLRSERVPEDPARHSRRFTGTAAETHRVRRNPPAGDRRGEGLSTGYRIPDT